MPAGHLHRRLMGQQSYLALLQSFGGTIRYYFPLDDASMPTAYPGAGGMNMPVGTITNNAFTNTNIYNTYQQDMGASFSNKVLARAGGSPPSFHTDSIYARDCLWTNQGSGSVCYWVKKAVADVSTGDVWLISLSGGGLSMWCKYKQSTSEFINTFHTTTVRTGSFDCTVFDSPALVGMTAYNSGSDLINEYYVNGTLVNTITAVGAAGGSPLVAAASGTQHVYHAGAGSPAYTTYIGGPYCVTGVALGATEFTKIYNAGK